MSTSIRSIDVPSPSPKGGGWPEPGTPVKLAKMASGLGRAHQMHPSAAKTLSPSNSSTATISHSPLPTGGNSKSWGDSRNQGGEPEQIAQGRVTSSGSPNSATGYYCQQGRLLHGGCDSQIRAQRATKQFPELRSLARLKGQALAICPMTQPRSLKPC